jgi:quercetin dioxygenase-like cupin family protein
MFDARKYRSLTLALCSLGPLTLPAVARDGIQNAPAESLQWEKTSEGVAFARLRGNRFVEPYMAMVRLPAGMVSPAHTKSADMFGVVIAGAMTHSPLAAASQDATVLPAGSFYRIPANVPHVSSCVSAVPCVTFLYQDGKFDFRPVSP